MATVGVALYHVAPRVGRIMRDRPFLLILPAAAVARLLWVHFFTGTIESEGAEYARIAENLIAGKGYIGMGAEGTELLFPPLFPWLIAAVTLITHQSELAGRLVSVLMGTLLVFPVYGITLHLYDRKTALVAAALVALHPLLINVSATVYCESTYMTLVLSGMYFGQRCLRGAGAWAYISTGACFACAYLIRVEAVLYLPLTILLVIAVTVATDRLRVKRVAGRLFFLAAAFLIVTAPYVAWLSVETGGYRLIGKDTLNYAVSAPMSAGRSALDLAYGIDGELKERGVWMRPNSAVIATTHYGLGDFLGFAVANAKHNLPAFIEGVSSRFFLGSPVLFSLVVLGLLRRPWRARQIQDQLWLFMAIGVTSLAIVGTSYLSARFYFIVLPIMIVWGARGLAEAARWARGTARLMGWREALARWSGPTVQLAAVAALLAIAWRGVGNLEPLEAFDDRTAPIKAAGLWLDRFMPGPKTVMETYAIMAFHANASYVHFPFADASTALRYIDKKRVDFIVLEDIWLFDLPYLRDWIDNGVPDRRAQLIYSVRTPRLGRVVVYRWRSTVGAPSRVVDAPGPSHGGLPARRAARATGPLKVNSANPRYFTDGSGQSIYLTGSHTWSNLQDAERLGPAEAFDFDAYLKFLVAHNHNFTRLWAWEQADWAGWRPYHYRISPSAYLRTGPGTARDGEQKFDLTRFDPAYFDRLRTRVIAAGIQGVYVSLMLFNGFSIEGKGRTWENPWLGHPYQRDNNINGVDGDPGDRSDGVMSRRLGHPAILRYEEDYVRKVVDTVNDLDNVLYEICNECDKESTAWQYHMIAFIKDYEATKPKQHPVGMTANWPGGTNAELLASPADWISPDRAGGYDDNPPATGGAKVILTDTDHIWGSGGDRGWVWKSFTRGLNPIFMDAYDEAWRFPPDIEANGPRWESLRRNMGYTLTYANRIALSKMTPRGDLASSGYCLANPTGSDAEFLVYLPSGGEARVDLRTVATEMSIEWFDPAKGTVAQRAAIGGGAVRSFAAPFVGDAVLYLRAQPLRQNAGNPQR